MGYKVKKILLLVIFTSFLFGCLRTYDVPIYMIVEAESKDVKQ